MHTHTHMHIEVFRRRERKRGTYVEHTQTMFKIVDATHVNDKYGF